MQSLAVGAIPTSFKLRAVDTLALVGDVVFKWSGKQIYVGGKGEDVIFNVVPMSKGNTVQLRHNQYRVTVEKDYPYSLYLSVEPVPSNEKNRELFVIDYINGEITLRSETKEGFRFVSYGEDRVVRCVGLEINDIKINDYHFTPEFNTASILPHGFIPTNNEVKYFTEIDSPKQNKTLDIKFKKELETNLLIDCPLQLLTNESLTSVPINIAVIKTNFTPTGTFNNNI